jgi:hypothetical protein
MTAADTVTPTVNLALLAVATHLVDHGLPAPKDLTVRHDDRRLQVHIDATHLAAWLSSGFCDDVRTVTGFDHLTPPTRDWGRVDIDGRLPDTGTRVRLSYFQRADVTPAPGPAALRAVTA